MSAGGPSDATSLAAVLDRWDALVEHWGLDGEEREMLIGGVVTGPIDDVASYQLEAGERRIRILVELEPVLTRLHGSRRRVRAWLRASNANLGGRTPMKVLSSSIEWGRWMIDNLGGEL